MTTHKSVNHRVKDCIVCGADIPSKLTIAVYCIRCRGVAAEIMRSVRAEMSAANLPPASGDCIDCGAKATCYDHRYYSMPLEVDPVCIKCNTNRGPALDIVDLVRARLGLDRQPKQQQTSEPSNNEIIVADQSLSLPERLDKIETQEIVNAIRLTNGNHTAAARILGINYRSMRYRVNRLGIK